MRKLSPFATQVLSMLALYPDEFRGNTRRDVYHPKLGLFRLGRVTLTHCGDRGGSSSGSLFDPAGTISPRHLSLYEQWVLRRHFRRWAQRAVDLSAEPTVSLAMATLSTPSTLTAEGLQRAQARMQRMRGLANAMAVDPGVVLQNYAADAMTSGTSVFKTNLP